MLYVRVHFENGYCGCDETDVWEYPDNVTQEDVANDCEEHLYDYAESFAHVAFGWDEEYSESDFDDYLDSCYYTFDIISENELTEDDKEILGWEEGE